MAPMTGSGLRAPRSSPVLPFSNLYCMRVREREKTDLDYSIEYFDSDCERIYMSAVQYVL